MSNRIVRGILTVLVLLVPFALLSSDANAQQQGSGIAIRTETGATLYWLHIESSPVAAYTIEVFLGGDSLGTAVAPADTTVREVSFEVELSRPMSEYLAVVTGPDQIEIPIEAFGAGPGGGGGAGTGGGNVNVGGSGGGGRGNRGPTDPLAQRIQAAAEQTRADAEFLAAAGEYANQMAEARIKVAQAVDLELENWKKHVFYYFDRREENLLSRMKIRDLYDMKSDQTLHLKSTAARRRYEYITKHPRSTKGGTHSKLNFMLELFTGTPVGFGISIEELFAGNPQHTRWSLNPDMFSKLLVRTRSKDGRWLEFRLDEPAKIGLEWPRFFRAPQYDDQRRQIAALNDELVRETNPELQTDIVEKIESEFAKLSRPFFEEYGPKARGKHLDMETYLTLRRAEDFLHQKHREVTMFLEDPSVIRDVYVFDPVVDGKDAGTLVAWMNRNGVRFAKPKSGDEPTYQQVFGMMHEIYAVSGEPILDVPKTEVEPPPGPAPPGGTAQPEVDAGEIPDFGTILDGLQPN